MSLRDIGSKDEMLIGEGFDTFASALVRGTDEGKVVMLSAANTVALVTTDSNFIGVLRVIAQRDKAASVQTNGWAKVTYDGSNPVNGYNYLVGGATAGKVKVADEVAIKEVAITIGAGTKTASSAADPDLVGGLVVGYRNDTNQDQFVDDVTLGVDGAVTLTLAANATADNKFKVAVMKATSKWPNRYLVNNVNSSANTCEIWLG